MINYFSNKLKNFFYSRKYFVKKKNKILFSIRSFGGATAGRGVSFFSKEPATVSWIDSFEDNSRFLDIGANIGIYSLYAATRNIRVVSFEPESSNFYQLNLNILDNSFEKLISAYPICAGNVMQFGNLNLETLKVGGSGHTFLPNSNKNANSKKLFSQGSVSISIDEFVKLTNFIPNYIKIDVDGNEDSVIRGMVETIKNVNLKSILIEIDDDNRSHRDCVDFILCNNFRIYKREIYVNKLGNYIFTK